MNKPERPSTPPPYFPLTPPPTGGLKTFADFSGTIPSKTTQRHLKAPEGDSLTACFDKPQEDSNSSSRREPIVSVSESDGSTPTPASEPSIESSTIPLPDLEAVVVDAVEIHAPESAEPFPFLNLPISVRKMVYENLLVVPALICVRQKLTPPSNEKNAYLHTESRQLLTGIAYALAQVTVGGPKAPFSRFNSTNINILYANKHIFNEAKTILYGKNDFEIVKPSNEMSPPPNFSVRLFPPGCQRLVSKLTIRIRSFYDLTWLLTGGYNVIKNFYRGLTRLTLLLELDSLTKGFGRQWARKHHETWAVYVKRLYGDVARHLVSKKDLKVRVPAWIHLRVLFTGENYIDYTSDAGATWVHCANRDELRKALGEAWELFRKVGG